jgi:hypothetical protein
VHSKNICGVFELAIIKCMFISQLNALQELHLWVCLNLQELNVCLLTNWMDSKIFIFGVLEFARISCTSISVTGTKIIKTIRFPKDMNKGRLHLKSQIMKQKHMCKIRFQQKIIAIKIKCCDKKMYPKLMLNRLKVMGNSTFIYTHWAPSSRNLFKKTSNLHVAHVDP